MESGARHGGGLNRDRGGGHPYYHASFGRFSGGGGYGDEGNGSMGRVRGGSIGGGGSGSGMEGGGGGGGYSRYSMYDSNDQSAGDASQVRFVGVLCVHDSCSSSSDICCIRRLAHVYVVKEDRLSSW